MLQAPSCVSFINVNFRFGNLCSLNSKTEAFDTEVDKQYLKNQLLIPFSRYDNFIVINIMKEFLFNILNIININET